MLTRDFPLRVKGLDESGSFTGYGSTYGPPADLTGDICQAGCFAQSIAQQGAGVPILFSHKQDEPVGIGKLSDSATGLVVNGQLLMELPTAKKAHLLLKAQVIKGMSIGFTLPRGAGKVIYNNDGTRTLKEVHVHEISLVAVPADPRAQVVSVKTLGDVQHVLKTIHDATDPEVVSALRSINVEMKRLLQKDSSCTCDCGECLAGDCVDCSDAECDDPNCEGSMAAQQATEELAALKALAMELKAIRR